MRRKVSRDHETIALEVFDFRGGKYRHGISEKKEALRATNPNCTTCRRPRGSAFWASGTGETRLPFTLHAFTLHRRSAVCGVELLQRFDTGTKIAFGQPVERRLNGLQVRVQIFRIGVHVQ